MFIVKRQRITGIHSGRREEHHYLNPMGGWSQSQSDAHLFCAPPKAEALAKMRAMPGVLSIVVREHTA